MNPKITKKHAIVLVVALLALFIIIVGGSYAFFTNTVRGKEYVVYSGTLAVSYEKKTNVVNLNNTKPMTNSEGLATTAYSFDVKNNGGLTEKYQVRLEEDTNNTLPLEYVKISVYKNDTEYLKPTKLSDLNTNLVIGEGELDSLDSDNYKVRLWVDINTPNDMVGKEFKARVVIDAMQDVEEGFAVNTRPIITLNKLNNETHINLLTGSTFTDPGVDSIKDDKDNLDKNNITITYEYFDGTNLTTSNGVDTNQPGIYYIRYSILDNDGLTGSTIRVVTVNSTGNIPNITLNGSSVMEVSQGSVFTDPGVTVDNNIQVATIGEVKTTKVGTYIVRYIAIDSDNNMNSVTRTVNVTGVNLSGFALKIYQNSNIITTAPTLADADGNAIASSECNWVSPNYVCTARDEAGLYSMDVTDGFGGRDGTTYYFRGNVENNYVSFGKWAEDLYYGYYYYGNGIGVSKRFSSLTACQNDSSYHNDCTKMHDAGDDILWRIIRINEDGTVRMIPNDEIFVGEYEFNSNSGTSINDMYYTNSTIKTIVDNWYNSNIGNNQTYASKVATGNYFCQAAKVMYDDTYNTGSATMELESDYLPDLKCETDGNNYGLVNGNVGLINYDELRLAGAGEDTNTEYNLYRDAYWMTMSPAGMDTENYTDDDTGDPIDWASIWSVYKTGDYSVYSVQDSFSPRPVINIKNNVEVSGTGIESDPYVIE